MCCEFPAAFIAHGRSRKAAGSRNQQVNHYAGVLRRFHYMACHTTDSHFCRSSFGWQDEDAGYLSDAKRSQYIGVLNLVILDALGRKKCCEHKDQIIDDGCTNSDLIVKVSYIGVNIGFIDIDKVENIKEDRKQSKGGR